MILSIISSAQHERGGGGRGKGLRLWRRRVLLWPWYIKHCCCFVRKFYQEVLPCDDESDGQVGRGRVMLAGKYWHWSNWLINTSTIIISPSMTLHIWWTLTCWLQFSSSCSSPSPSPSLSHFRRRRNTRSSCESAESLSDPVWHLTF